ncbi:sulfate transporter subunit, partial [Clostridioides difficile]
MDTSKKRRVGSLVMIGVLALSAALSGCSNGSDKKTESSTPATTLELKNGKYDP